MPGAISRLRDNPLMKPIGEIVTTLGRAYDRANGFPFGLRDADRLMHLHVIGQTGTGKSTLLANLALQDAARGIGFCLIDPHGDLAEAVAERITGEAIVWRVADPGCPYGYNPLTRVPAAYRPLVASGLIDALRKQWSDAWGPRMEHLLRHALLGLLDQPRADLTDIMPLFLDRERRLDVLRSVEDAQVRAFWEHEYDAMRYKGAVDGVAPIANKLGAFLAHPLVRRAVTAPKEPLRFRRIMDRGQPLIINLAKGRLGADVSNVLGGLIVSSIVNAAFSRHDVPADQRRPFMLSVDEFHAFTTETLADMLAEVRKYGLGLTLAHQHSSQVDPAVFEAILGNTGSLMVFRLGARDAPLFVRQLESVTIGDLINLPNHQAYVRLMVDGTRTRTFTAETVPVMRARTHGDVVSA